MKPSEVLVEMRDVLAARGWTQNCYMDEPGRRCLLGAAAAVWSPERCPALSAALTALEDKIAEMYPCGAALRSVNSHAGSSLPVFNDAPGRTLQEILDLIDKTLIGLEEKGQ
jgi:hypothetical protein